MKNNNGNNLYMHRIIKLISPITCQTFKVELNGEEDEMRELLGTILEINPKSIKGLRDSFNNYYTISSAVKNPLLNTDPYNYYTVVIKGINQSNDIKYIKYPSLNLSNREQISNGRINYEKNFENKTMNFLEDENNYFQQNIGKYKTKDLLKFSSELYKRNYIDKNLKKKLNKLIKDNNIEVISILQSYLDSKKSYDELAQKIKPVISSSSQNSDSKEDSKSNSSRNSSNSKHKKNHKHKSKKEKDTKDKNTKKENTTKEEKILNDIKLNFGKEQYSKLEDLLKKKNPEIIKFIKKFEKDNDYNYLISKLNSISKSFKENSEDQTNSEISNEASEDSEDDSEVKKNDSSDYIKEGSKNKKKNKGDIKEENNKIKNITKKICNAMKKSRKDLYYIAKFDLDKMKTEEKKSLFKKKFKLNLDKITSENNYKIPKKNISIIEKYYTQYMLKKVFNNFNDDEKSLYDQLCEEEDDNNVIYQIYKDLLKHKDLNEFKSQIKKIIEEAEKIDMEEGEEEDEDNKKSDIKEENEEEEEEDYEGEEDEENEGDENDDDQEKKEDSSSYNFILKNDDKDATAKVLNNNYRKNYHFSNFANSNNKNNEAKSKSKSKSKDKENSANKSDKEDKKNNEEENNLGLNFVVIKPKKVNKEEEKKDHESNGGNTNVNLYANKAKENSVSTSNNPNKKISAFISQIEHIKKIDEIKTTIIEAIHRNNKYIMELYEKFQKNKSILNKKSLYDVYNKIKANPDSMNNTGENNKKFSSFKALIQEINELDEREKEFLCYDFINNKNSLFIGAYNGYEELNDKDEFFETIILLKKNRNVKELFVQFCVKKMKEDGNNDIFENSKEIINIMKKNDLYNEKDCEMMENYLGSDDGVFLGIFREFFKTENFNDFMETMNMALNDKKKGGNSKETKSKWDNDLIKKNYEELKKNMEEKYYKSLDDLFKKRSEKLFNILQGLNSSNLNSKIETATVLILKKDLSPT